MQLLSAASVILMYVTEGISSAQQDETHLPRYSSTLFWNCALLVYSTSSGVICAPMVLSLDSAAKCKCDIAVVFAVKLLDGPALYRAAILGESLAGLCNNKVSKCSLLTGFNQCMLC